VYDQALRRVVLDGTLYSVGWMYIAELWIQKALHSGRKCLIIEKYVFFRSCTDECVMFLLLFGRRWMSPSLTRYVSQSSMAG
jgi:hypothetical protein